MRAIRVSPRGAPSTSKAGAGHEDRERVARRLAPPSRASLPVFATQQFLCCVVLDGTGESFQPEDDMLQRLEVCDLVQWRCLELRKQRLDRVRIERFGNSFQPAQSSRCGFQHPQHFPFDGRIADQLWLVYPPVLPQDIAEESGTDGFLHLQNALIEVIASQSQPNRSTLLFGRYYSRCWHLLGERWSVHVCRCSLRSDAQHWVILSWLFHSRSCTSAASLCASPPEATSRITRVVSPAVGSGPDRPRLRECHRSSGTNRSTSTPA